MRNLLLTILLFSGIANAQLEVSIVTDWETVSHYGSVDEANNVIDSTIAYADILYNNQLDLYIDVIYRDVPQIENDDKLPNHTHPEALMDALFDYRIASTDHMNADLTILLTTRKLSTGSTNYVGYARIKSICSANALVIVSLYDNGLDGQTLAHELAHVLGAVHDGDSPCESTPSRGYLMSSAVHNGNDNLSQCSIDTIKSTLAVFGSCMAESVPEVVVPPVTTPVANSGGGAIGIFTLLLLLVVTMRKHGRTS